MAEVDGLGRRRRGKADVDAMRMVGRSVPGEKKTRQRVKRNESIAQCKREFWDALPSLLNALIEGAKQGKATHMKMLIELGGLGPGAFSVKGRKKKEKSWVDDLMDQWEKEKAAARDAAAAVVSEVQPVASGGLDEG